MAEYLTNDNDGRYFKERYIADVNVPDGEFMVEYFNHMEEALQWIAENKQVRYTVGSRRGSLNEQWHTGDNEGYCYLHHYRVV